MAFSRSRERRVSGVVWLGAFSFCQSLGDGGGQAGHEEWAYRPTSKEGEAMGERSVVMVKMPSNLRSGKGAVTEAEMRAMTL